MISGFWSELSEVQRLKKTFAIENEYLFSNDYYVNPISDMPYDDTGEVREALIDDLFEQSISNSDNGDYYKELYENNSFPNNRLLTIEEFDKGRYLLIDIWHSDDGDGYSANVFSLKDNWRESIEVED